MSNFDAEQIVILREINQTRNSLKIRSKRLKNEGYVDTIFTHLQPYIPPAFELVKAQRKIGLPMEFSLFVITKNRPPNVPYSIKDIQTAIEIRGNGWVEKGDVEQAIESKKKVYDGITQNHNIKCLYMTGTEIKSYAGKSRKYLGPNYFLLGESNEGYPGPICPGVWEKFINSIP